MVVRIGNDFIIRPATNGDTENVRMLVFGVLAEFGLAGDPETTDADLGDIEGYYLNRGGMFEVIETDRFAIVGSVGIYPMDDRRCELRKMYLAREVRGKGLGKLLLERAISFARSAGFTSIVLETASVLKDAISLYERYGFRPVASDHLAARADQAYVLEILNT
jgi:GNAT superfamily N-acetyltransferase